MKNIYRSIPFALAIVAAAPAFAQTSAPATPLPDLDGFSLPSSRPTPRAAPDAQPTTGAVAPAAAPTPPAPVVTAPVEAPRVAPTVRVAPVPRPSSAPRVSVPERPAPVATPTAVAAPTPSVPVPGAAPTRAADPVVPMAQPTAPATASARSDQAATQPDAGPQKRSPALPLLLGLLVLAIALAGIVLWRRRSRGEVPGQEQPRADAPANPSETWPDRYVAAEPAAEDVPVAGADIAQDRAQIEIDCFATRAGTNLLSAAVDYRIVVRNVGAALATGVRLDIRLLGMGKQHDALLGALFAMPIEKSIAAPFDLPPGTAVDLNGMAMHPKDTIETVEIGGRAMVVPLLAINLRYGWPDDGSDGGRGQTARPFVIGIDPGTGGRLQPFRLDATARMVQNVAIIAYTDGVTT